MLNKLLPTTILLVTSLLTTMNCAAKSILFGVMERDHDKKITRIIRTIELLAVKDAIHKPVRFKYFNNDKKLISFITKQQKKLSLLYVKPSVGAELAQLKNWTKIAQLLAVDPDTKKWSSTYSTYLITAQQSHVKHLSDLANKKIAYYNQESVSNYVAIKKLIAENKIPGVQWVKTKNSHQALELVAQGKVEAVGVWDYPYLNDKNNKDFRIISKVANLENPTLYGNTLNLTEKQIVQLKASLKKESSKVNAEFSY